MRFNGIQVVDTPLDNLLSDQPTRGHTWHRMAAAREIDRCVECQIRCEFLRERKYQRIEIVDIFVACIGAE